MATEVSSAPEATPGHDIAAIDALFQPWDTTRSPGAAVAVYRAGELAFARGYGMANLEHGVPISPDSIFHVASISKQFTDACIALLAAAGKLAVDDDIRTYVPEVPDFGAPITLRHLIHHTSGLRDQWDLLAFAGWRPDDLITEDDVLDVVRRQTALNFPPGERHLYCNTGYTLLAVVVHRISGQTLRAFAADHVFTPLGMVDTHVHDNHREIVPGRTQAYAGTATGWEVSIPVFDVAGTTSLFTTVRDLHRWHRNFDDPDPVVGGRPLIDHLLTRGVLNDGTVIDYAWGLKHRVYRGAPVVEHSGADAGYRAHLLRLPEHDLGVAVLANADGLPVARLAERIVDIVLGAALASPSMTSAQFAPRPDWTAKLDPAAFAGLYRSEQGDEFEHFALDDGALRLGYLNLLDLDQVGAREFRLASYPSLLFRFSDPEQPPVTVSLDDGTSESGTILSRVEPRILGPASLAPFAGRYTCADAGVTWELAVTGPQLMLRRRKFRPVPLLPATDDTFVTDALHGVQPVVFTRDAARAVTGFTIRSGRVLDLAFQRDDKAWL